MAARSFTPDNARGDLSTVSVTCPMLMVQRGRAHGLVFRVWQQHEPEIHAAIVSGRAGARPGVTKRLALRHRGERLRVDKTGAGRRSAWRAVAAVAARPCGARHL